MDWVYELGPKNNRLYRHCDNYVGASRFNNKSSHHGMCANSHNFKFQYFQEMHFLQQYVNNICLHKIFDM